MNPLTSVPPAPWIDSARESEKRRPESSTMAKKMNTNTTGFEQRAHSTVSPFEVFNACVSDLTGKDKIAKTVQYALRLLVAIHDTHGLGNRKVAERFLFKEKVQPIIDDVQVGIRTGSDSIDRGQVQPHVAYKVETSPILLLGRLLPVFTKILGKYACLLSVDGIHKSALLLLAYVTKKLSSLLDGLNIYRHLLRAGTIPFRVWKFTNHIKYSLRVLLDSQSMDGHAVRIEKVIKYWTSKDMISQMVNFWYAISDELLLLFRFKILLEGKGKGSAFSNALFTWAEDHELYSWMGSILLGLNNDWGKWMALKEKESRIILNRKVKARTRRIVEDIKRQSQDSGNMETSKLITPEVDDEDDEKIMQDHHDRYVDELAEVRDQLYTVKINAIRLSCDMIFDAKYILHWNMYKPLHVTLGLLSGSLGLYNTYRAKRAALEEQQLRNL